ncbi:MAG: Phenylalanine--tRNA ligase beta subunit [Hyphomicrobiaceae bacterium hypho_1]
MKFTLSWLKDHLETELSLDVISKILSQIGLEVESITDLSDELGAFKVARIVSSRQHPNADKLRICQVEVEHGKPAIEIICGAENAYEGLLTVFAPIGTLIPETGIKLQRKPVRGVVSNGMLVSSSELRLNHISNHDGIIELSNQHLDKIGQRYIDVEGLNDPVIEIGLTPNRPDCTGVRGIARDLAAAGAGRLKPEPKLGKVEGLFGCPVDIELKLEAEFKDACPIFAGRYVKGVKNGFSPLWMRQRLLAVGVHTHNALVDITNYICIDRGRPLHVYDADKISNSICLRMTEAGEKLLALDGKLYTSDHNMCAITDNSGILAYAGIIGGQASKCTKETNNVFIECAYFDPVITAESGRKKGISSDARYRFERGVDPGFVERGLDLATDMILKFCGGQPSKKRIVGKPPIKCHSINFNPYYVKKLTGLEVPSEECRRILQEVGCKIDGKGGEYRVFVPSWRNDLHGSADLVEEIIRIIGLDYVPSVALPRKHGVVKPVLTIKQKTSRIVRRALASCGLVEAITWSFLPYQQAMHFGGGSSDLELDNPISVDLASMRPSLLPGLLTAAQRNINRGFPNVALFELGHTYFDNTDKGQSLMASGVRFNTAKLAGSGRHWSGNAPLVNIFDVKADFVAVLSSIGIDISRTQITCDTPAWFHPGRSGAIQMGPKLTLGYFGEIHPATLRFLDIKGPAMAFEITLSSLPSKRRNTRSKLPMVTTNLLPIRRDFSFVLDKSVSSNDVVKAIAKSDRSLIRDINVFDVFEGGVLSNSKKSIAIEIIIQPKDTTLTYLEIEAVCSRVIKSVERATGGEIRD